MKKVFTGYGLFPLFTKVPTNKYGELVENYEILNPSLFCVNKPLNKRYKKIKVTVEIIEKKQRTGKSKPK